MLSCDAFFPLHSLKPLKDGWTDFLQEPSISRISLKRPLSKGTTRHLKPLSSLKKSATSSKKITKHYTKLGNGIMTYFINAQPMTSIAIRRNTDSSNNSEGIATIVNKLESLGRDIKKLKENVYAIQVGCQTCGGAHLDKECPLNEEVKNIGEVKYGEFGRPFPNNSRNDGRFNRGASGYDQPSSGVRRPSLTEKINKYMEEAAKRHAEQDEWLKKFYENTETNREAHDKIIQDGSPLYTPFYYSPEEIEYFSAKSGFSDNERQETDKSGMAEALAALEATHEIKKVPEEEKQSVNYYVDHYEPPIPFLRRLEYHAKEALVHKTMESFKKIKINRPLLKEIRQTDNYAKHMKDLVANNPRTKEEEEIRMNPNFNNALADLGASISIMPLSMYKRLGIGKLELINMVIEMDDNTKCTPKGIVDNLLIKIDKFVFPVDFVILDIVEDFRMPTILGRPLLATAHAKVDIFRKSISLELGNEKVIFKISSFTTMIFEFVPSIRSETCTEDDDFKKINYDLFLYDSGSCSHSKELQYEVSSTGCNVKPSRDFTRPLGPPSGLKGLWRMLNATVILMKEKRGAMRAFEQKTRDLDMEIIQSKEFTASYGVTTPKGLRRNKD
ncbi:reverse transcriptase domain-containing protein [Tanacetum coccineum]